MTLSISDIKIKTKHYLIGIACTLVFGLIYEQFSHEVYSFYMMYAFIIPIIGLLLIRLIKIDSEIFDMGIVTITIFSILKGVFEIIGITNKYVIIYLIVGIILIIMSIVKKLLNK